jgi:hypothetical protein
MLRLALAALILFSGSAAAESPALAPPRKEPAYASKDPKYALLVFGPKAQTRVWVVLDLPYDPLREKPGDRDVLYADLNGNGDLTDPGERIPVEVVTRKYQDWKFSKGQEFEQHYPVFKLGDLAGRDGTKYTGLVLEVGWYVFGQKYREMDLQVTVPGRGKQSAGGPLLRFADKPETAPVIHFDGPLAMRLSTSNGQLHCPVDYTGKESPPPYWGEKPLVRGRECEITAQVGTFGIGPGTFVPITADIPPERTTPVAVVEFPHRDPAKPAIRATVELTQRCCGTLFKGKLRVPDEAAAGAKAKVLLSYASWAKGDVFPATGEVAVVEPEEK